MLSQAAHIAYCVTLDWIPGILLITKMFWSPQSDTNANLPKWQSIDNKYLFWTLQFYFELRSSEQSCAPHTKGRGQNNDLEILED